MQRLLLPLAWILVLAPLSWGVARSVQRSMPLFTAGNPAGLGTTAGTEASAQSAIATPRNGSKPVTRP